MNYYSLPDPAAAAAYSVDAGQAIHADHSFGFTDATILDTILRRGPLTLGTLLCHFGENCHDQATRRLFALVRMGLVRREHCDELDETPATADEAALAVALVSH